MELGTLLGNSVNHLDCCVGKSSARAPSPNKILKSHSHLVILRDVEQLQLNYKCCKEEVVLSRREFVLALLSTVLLL